MKQVPVVDSLEMARDNYLEYSKYVSQGRAYPQIYDGCKSSYKRVVYGMWKDAPRSKIKLAKLAACALPYHPHPTSISGVIIQLGDNGNKLKLMDTQGNWGDSSKGIQASAERYIGGRLSDLAISLLCDSMEYCRYITGEIDEQEPLALPTLIPLCFINGYQGIPSGLPKLNIPCINLLELIDYYIEILKQKDTSYEPQTFPSPNLGVEVISSRTEWEEILKTGKGSIRIRPVMELKDNKITITELPSSKTFEHVRKILEKEILTDKLDVIDETTDTTLIVIEKVFKKQCDMNEIYSRLMKKLECSESYNMAFFDENKIYVPCSFHKVVKANLDYLIETHQRRLAHQIDDLKKKLKILEIIEKLKNTNNIQNLFSLDYSAACSFIETNFNCDTDTAVKVLQKPLSYLTKEHQNEIQQLKQNITKLNNDNKDIYSFLITKYTDIRSKIADAIKDTFKPTIFV